MSEWGDFRKQPAPMPEHRAPADKLRVIACDTFEGPFADYLVGNFADLQAAIRAAIGALEPMTAVYVYDDKGVLQFNDYQTGGGTTTKHPPDGRKATKQCLGKENEGNDT